MAQSANGNVVPLGDHPRARARLSSQESASVLTSCRDMALDRMCSALGGMLDKVEDELFELANKSTDREAQHLYLDAHAQARDKRLQIESTFRQHFLDCFNRKVRGESATPPHSLGSGELKLVEDDDLEETLAVSEMSRKLKAACEDELFALGQRMGFLMERPELADDANPLSPATVCSALKDACDQLQSGFRVRMAVLQQLERHAESALHDIYHDVNLHLVERRILPEVRAGTRRAPSTPKREAAAEAASNEPADLFSTLAQLLAAGNGNAAGGNAQGGAPAGKATPVSPRAFVTELTRMHRDDPVSQEEAAGALVNVVRALKQGENAAAIGSVDAMTIDLVAMLFDYVFEDKHIPASVKALLGRLQIPTLKVALLDKTFFSAKSHPARRLIDRMAELSIGLDDSNEKGSVTLAFIGEVVDGILTEFDTDLELFESMVRRVEEHIGEHKQAEADIVQRSARVIEAREREEVARLVSEEEIQRRLKAHSWVPPVVRAVLEQHWTRAMTAAYLAEGEGTAAWHDLGTTVEDLLWSVEPKSTADDRKRLVTQLPAMLKRLQAGMERAEMSDAERDTFLGALVDCHAAAVKAGLRGMAVVPEAPAPVALPPQDPELESQLLPAGDVQVEEIRLKAGPVRNVFTRTGIWTNLQRGTWAEFVRPSGAMRARLTWISPNKGVYLFTNPLSGAVAVSISPEALAEQMRLGHARLLDHAPLVERAVDSMLQNLRNKQAG